MEAAVIVRVMIKLFLIMALGAFLKKIDILDTRTCQKLSVLVTTVTVPLLGIAAALTSATGDKSLILIYVGASFIMYFLFILWGKFCGKLMPTNREDAKKAYAGMMCFANTAFMGYPLVQSLFGTEAIFYASMIHLPFGLYFYTYGLACYGAYDNQTEAEKTKKGSWKRFINPGLIMTLISFAVYFFDIRSDGVVYESMYMVGNLTSGLSMLVMGATLIEYPLKESLTDWRAYLFTLEKLAIPIATFFVCRLLGVDDYFTGIFVITNATPVAATNLMAANQYQSSCRDIIVRGILVTTLSSLITIPVIAILFLR